MSRKTQIDLNSTNAVQSKEISEMVNPSLRYDILDQAGPQPPLTGHKPFFKRVTYPKQFDSVHVSNIFEYCLRLLGWDNRIKFT
jgi:hypothetical protein